MKGLVIIAIVFLFFDFAAPMVFSEAPALQDVVTLIGPCPKQLASAERVKQGIEFLEKKRTDRPVGITTTEVDLAVDCMISWDILEMEKRLANSNPGIDPLVIAELKNQLADLKNRNAEILTAIKTASELSASERQNIRKEIRALADKVDELAEKLCQVLRCMLETLGALSDKLDAAIDLLKQVAADTEAIRKEQAGQTVLLGKMDRVGLDTNSRVRWLVQREEAEADEEDDYPDCLSALFGVFFRVKREGEKSQFREPTLEGNARMALAPTPIYANVGLGGLPFYVLGTLNIRLNSGPHSFFIGGGGVYLYTEKRQTHALIEAGYKYDRYGFTIRAYPFEPRGKQGIEILGRVEIY